MKLKYFKKKKIFSKKKNICGKKKFIKEYYSRNKLKKLEKIFTEKKEKEKSIKRIIKLTTKSSSGLKDIKNTLAIKNAEIHYIGSSKFSVSSKAKDFKTANNKLEETIEKIKELAKKHQVNIEIK